MRPEQLHIAIEEVAERPRRDAVDRARTIFWFEHLRVATGCHGPAALERALEPAAAQSSKLALCHRNAWYAYAKGGRTPQLRRRLKAAELVPGSLTGFDHVLWEALRTDRPVGRRADRLLRATGSRIEAQLFKRGLDGSPASRVPLTTWILRRIESRPGQDSLAALTILLREAAERQDFQLAQGVVEKILRVLLVYSTNPYVMNVAPLLYQLFLRRIFPLAKGEGTKYDFEGYDFDEASQRLLNYLLWAKNTGGVSLKAGEEARYLLRQLRDGSGLPLQWWLLTPLFPGLEPEFRDGQWLRAWRAQHRAAGGAAAAPT